MLIKLTDKLINQLKKKGITTFLRAGATLPDAVVFEPPCSLKWMSIQHSLHIGAFSYAVSGFYFGCRIGRYCSFGEHVQIGRHSHPLHYFSTSPFFYNRYIDVLDQDAPQGIELIPHRDFSRNSPPVVPQITHIGHDVWVGHGAFILPGVKIGNGAVVAAQSVVTKDVPAYAVVAGSPARILRYRFSDDEIEALLLSNWWDYAPWELKGVTVDDILAFTAHIKDMREQGVDVYRPELIELDNMTAKANPGVS